MGRSFLNVTFLVTLCTIYSSAQSVVTGRVVDYLTNKPVKEATVTYDTISTHTNYSGYFQLTASAGDTLTISHIEYELAQIVVPRESKFSVSIDIRDNYLKFGNGINEFYNYFTALRYPAKARSKKIQATIYVQFEINDLGSMTNVQYFGDTGNIFSEQIATLIKTINKSWSPEYNGKKFLLPITYRFMSVNPIMKTPLSEVVVDRVLNEITIVGY